MTLDSIVAGHLTRHGTRADIEVHREYLLDLENPAATQIRTFHLVILQTRYVSIDNSWLLFTKYIEAIDKQC